MIQALNNTLVCLNRSEFIVWQKELVVGNITNTTNQTTNFVFQVLQSLTPIMTNPTIDISHKMIFIIGILGLVYLMTYVGIYLLNFLFWFIIYVYASIKGLINRKKHNSSEVE